ncbi:MAG TPA: glycosyl hydrolase family 28-related protein, partial [Bryobacteraceae bacterium]|nr:glycosyl hydrolase family 28-related protein [Bryobacteraceae bacterium]
MRIERVAFAAAMPLVACVLAVPALPAAPAEDGVFNINDYGATGYKSEDARPAIQRAIDAAAAEGGGTVYLPPGEYTS